MDKSQDMLGRTCMVTGASSGIGFVAARELARKGASVIMVCRDPGRAEEARRDIVKRTGNLDVSVMLADLSSQKEIRRLVDEFEATERPLHVLLNNAGVVMLLRTLTSDELETTFAVNHLAYFLLTNLLLHRLRESVPARIVNVASDAHRMSGVQMRFDDLQGEKEYKVMRNYGQSKLANILFTRELARRLEGTGVTANCLHPGMVGTNLGRNNGFLAKTVVALLRPFAVSAERGADTAIYLCTAPEVEKVSGKYFSRRKEHRPSRAARNDEDARKLWEVSARLAHIHG